MKIIKTIFLIIMTVLPSVASASFAVGWNSTSTTAGLISPNLVNGVEQTVFGKNFISTSTNFSSLFPYASTTVLSASALCLTGDLPCRSVWPTGGGGGLGWASTTVPNTNSIYSTALENVGIGTTSPYAKLSVNGGVVSSYYVSTSTTIGNQFYGDLYIGNALAPQLDAFGTKNYEFQILGNVNDVVAGTIYNRSTGSTAASGLFFQNNKSSIGGIGATQTYYGGLIYGGGNWNGVPLGFGALGANDFGVYTTDGNLVLSAASTTAAGSTLVGNINLFTGTGSFSGGVPDFTLTYAGNMGLGTTSPYAKLSVVGEAVARNFTATSTTATSTLSGGLVVGNNGIVHQIATGTTTITNLNMGNLNFDINAGVTTFIDNPINTTVTTGTTQSYTANVMGSSTMTWWGLADNTGYVQNGDWRIVS